MITSKQLQKEIEKKQSSLSDEELFNSNAFYNNISSIPHELCYSTGTIPVVKTQYNPNDSLTACTNCKTIWVNLMNELIQQQDETIKKYVAIVGLLTHECGHVLYTDFYHSNEVYDSWLGYNFSWGRFVDVSLQEKAEEAKKALNTYPNIRSVFIYDMKSMVNVMEDIFIENMLNLYYSGIYTAGLSLLNNALYECSKTTQEELYEKVVEGSLSITAAVIINLQIKFKLGKEVRNSQNLSKEEEHVKVLVEDFIDKNRNIIEKLCWESDGSKRWMLNTSLAINSFELFMNFYKNRPNEEGNQQGNSSTNNNNSQSSDSSGSSNQQNTPGKKNSSTDKQSGENSNNQQNNGEKQEDNGTSASNQQSSGSSTNGEQHGNLDEIEDFTNGQAEQMNENSENQQKDNGVSATPKGNSFPKSSNISEQEKEKAEAEKEANSQLSEDKDYLEKLSSKAIKSIVQEMVETAEEKKMTEQMQKEAQQLIENASEKAKKVLNVTRGLKVSRVTNVTKEMVDEYNKVYNSVSKTSKSLVRKINSIIEERDAEGYESGFMMGKRFDADSYYKHNGKYFSKEIEPSERPKIAFGLLVDESGSMKGEKRENARKVAIMLEYVLRNVHVPLMVCGHSQTLNYVQINDYVSFDCIDKKDCYRLTQTSSYGGNLDTVALSYVAEKLIQRPEENKILIVISDGCPNEGAELLSKTVEYYRKKGIKVFAAIIDDYEYIEKIYGEQFAFDCTNYQKLEVQFVKLIKRYVIKNV